MALRSSTYELTDVFAFDFTNEYFSYKINVGQNKILNVG